MQTVSVDQLVGNTLGDYRVERLLGRGKLSAVYMAQQRSLNRTVMVTTFILPATLSAEARERFNMRFLKEGAPLVRLNHPHILPVYDFGVQFGLPYLVTSFVKTGSLAQVLKQQQRFTPERALDMVKQIAAGLDYAHSQGAVHGLLNPANILVSSEQTLQVTGFGLKQMLQMRGIETSYHPQAHLFNIGGTFLGAPEYLAPECVQDLPFDARADVYSLGIMFFELLSGSLPFTGAEPLVIAAKRLQQPVPALHELSPDLPAAYDLLFYQALEHDPGKRFKYAGEVPRAFERVLKLLKSDGNASATANTQTTMHSQITLPPTVNWFDEGIIPTRKWQLMPPVVTGHLPAVQAPAQETAAAPPAPAPATSSWQYESPAAGQTGPVKPSSLDARPQNPPGADPFAWWSATSASPAQPAPGTFARSATRGLSTGFAANRQRKASIKGRRQVVIGLLAGTSVVGILGIGGISFARFIQSMKQTQPGNTVLTAASPTHVAKPAPTHGTQRKPVAPRAQPSPAKTAQPTPKPQPTQPPQPTPTPPAHTGTVIGSTKLPINSSKDFINPADGNNSLLIHLPNGNFVACERACTHEGVPVYYDNGSQQLVCPAHNAIFDPANNFSVVQGPAQTPLPGVSIRVNADGTITTG